jgi:exodeoxyribonuclease-5
LTWFNGNKIFGSFEMNLDKEQKTVIEAIVKDIQSGEQITVLGGHAGVGKTTIVKHLKHFLGNWAVCAYTGKAAHVLRKKDLSDASTIHGLIYKPLIGPDGSMVLDKSGSPVFTLAEDLDVEGIIVDEASMVSKEIYNDLLSFGLPVIFVGDHGQLAPIGSSFNIMEHPKYCLEKIHRNAGEIAFFAEHIRKGYKPSSFVSDKAVKFVTMNEAKQLYSEVDQTICAYNKTRVEINIAARVQLWQENYQAGPVEGDRVVCLRNHRTQGLFNGMQGIVESLDAKKHKMVFNSEGDKHEIYYDPSQFNKEKYDFSGDRDDPHPFDFVYGSTCHKCQGDEFNDGLVIEQICKNWEHPRWAYVAASRIKKQCYWCSSR